MNEFSEDSKKQIHNPCLPNLKSLLQSTGVLEQLKKKKKKAQNNAFISLTASVLKPIELLYWKFYMLKLI